MSCAQVVLTFNPQVSGGSSSCRLLDLCPFYYVHGLLPKDPIFDSHWSWYWYIWVQHMSAYSRIFLLFFYSKERICCLFPIILSIFSPFKQRPWKWWKHIALIKYHALITSYSLSYFHLHFSLSVISHLPGTFCHFRFFLSTFVEYFYDFHVLSLF